MAVIVVHVIIYLRLSVDRTGCETTCCHFEIWAFTPICLCLSEETLTVVGPFDLVPVPGVVIV